VGGAPGPTFKEKQVAVRAGDGEAVAKKTNELATVVLPGKWGRRGGEQEVGGGGVSYSRSWGQGWKKVLDAASAQRSRAEMAHARALQRERPTTA
jgi:hypothetical protein